MTGNIIEELKVIDDTSLKFKKLSKDATLPTYGSEGATGLDLRANNLKDIDDIVYRLKPGQTVMVGTGVAVEIPLNHSGLILPRSGLASKKGLRPANTPGLIDPDYRGEIFVCLRNDSSEIQTIELGERIAQLLLVYTPVRTPLFVQELSSTDRGEGGFGSTGVN